MSPWQQTFLNTQQLPESFLAPALTLAKRLTQEHFSSLPTKPIIAVSGPQGSGKSTLSAFLTCYLKHELGLCAATVSLDDYYLAQSARQALSQDVHPLYLTRGVPGTHDVKRGIRDFLAYKLNQPVALPQFDKSTDNPTHDKAPEQLDVLIFEGWCVGVKAQSFERLIEPLNSLERDEDGDGRFRNAVNEQLLGDYKQWFELIDYLIFIELESFDSIVQWRAQQEAQLIEKSGRGMKPAELQRFMSFFERLTRWGQESLRHTCQTHVYMDVHHQMSIKR